MESSDQFLKCLLEMNPFFGDLNYLQLAARHLFLLCVKNQQRVRNVFFMKNGHLSTGQSDTHCHVCMMDTGETSKCLEFDFDRFSVLFVGQAICRLKDSFNFHKMLDEELIEAELNSIYKSKAWINIGFHFYSFVFREYLRSQCNNRCFKDYLMNRYFWANKLSEFYSSEFAILHDFPYASESHDEIQRKINVLMMKLQLLDSSAVQPTFDAIHSIIPDVSLDLKTISHLGRSLDWTLIKNDIEDAILRPSIPSNVSKFTPFDIEEFYGVRVFEFITTEAKDLGLFTGTHPDNHRISSLSDRCVVS